MCECWFMHTCLNLSEYYGVWLLLFYFVLMKYVGIFKAYVSLGNGFQIEM